MKEHPVIRIRLPDQSMAKSRGFGGTLLRAPDRRFASRIALSRSESDESLLSTSEIARGARTLTETD